MSQWDFQMALVAKDSPIGQSLGMAEVAHDWSDSVMLPKAERLRLLSGFVAKKSTGIMEFHGFSYSRDDPSKPNLTLMVLALPHSYCVWLKIKKTPKKSDSSKTIPTTSHNQHHLNLNPMFFPISSCPARQLFDLLDRTGDSDGASPSQETCGFNPALFVNQP